MFNRELSKKVLTGFGVDENVNVLFQSIFCVLTNEFVSFCKLKDLKYKIYMESNSLQMRSVVHLKLLWVMGNCFSLSIVTMQWICVVIFTCEKLDKIFGCVAKQASQRKLKTPQKTVGTVAPFCFCVTVDTFYSFGVQQCLVIGATMLTVFLQLVWEVQQIWQFRHFQQFQQFLK